MILMMILSSFEILAVVMKLIILCGARVCSVEVWLPTVMTVFTFSKMFEILKSEVQWGYINLFVSNLKLQIFQK